MAAHLSHQGLWLVARGVPRQKDYTMVYRPALARNKVLWFLEKPWKGDNEVNFFLKTIFDLF